MVRPSVIAAVAMFGSAANAAPIVLTFEGIGNFTPVGSFYSSQGVTFTNGVALVDQAAGGSGRFTNEPSPNSALFFYVIAPPVVNVPAGFTGSFSFYYSSETDSSIKIYDGLNGVGYVLATAPIVRQYGDGCDGVDTGIFCNWTRATVEIVSQCVV